MSEMKVKAIAPWFGGKRTLAADIVEQLGDHTQYFEPFAGSLAVLFAKPKSQKETVCDLHGDATNLARVLQNETTAVELYGMTQRTLFAEGILKDARGQLAEPFDPEDRNPQTMLARAYWFFVASWMGRNGSAGMERIDFQFAVRFKNDGGSPTVRWSHAVDSMPAWHKRLQNVVIMNRDCLPIIEKFEDSPKTAIYCDPPYVAETRKSGKYRHDFGSFDDHVRLSKLLNQFQHARIVVSYYDDLRIRKLYSGWTFIEKTMTKNMSLSSGSDPERINAPEVLIINGPGYRQPRDLFA